MKFSNLRDLYLHELKELYSLANQVVDFLPRMRDAAANDDLLEAFSRHADEAQEQIARVHAIYPKPEGSPEGEFSDGTHGLIVEAQTWISENAESEVMDAGLIAALQRILHHEIASYGCARTWAKLLGETSAEKFLQESLDEAIATDKKLTEIAGAVNAEAKELQPD